MPQVPVYDRQRVAPEATPSARLSTQSSGSAARIGDIGAHAALGIMKDERDKADQIADISSQRELNEFSNDALYGEEGALIKKGKDAFEIPNTVLPAYDKRASEIESGLVGDRQKNIFRRRADQIRAQLDLTIQRHVFTERQHYDTEQTTAFVKVERDSAMFNYNDPNRVMGSINNQVSAIEAFARRTGKSASWVTQQSEDAVSKTHLAVIERALASNDDMYASAYYKEVKGQIRSDEALKAAKLVTDGSYQGASQRWVDEMTKGGVQREYAQEEIKKIEDPKLRDAVQNRMDSYFARVDMMQRERNESAFKYATLVVDGGGNLESIPVGIRQQLTLGQLAGLKAYAKREAKGEKIETDWGTYYKLQKMAGEDPNAFLKHDLLQYKGVLEDAEFKEMVHLQNGLRKGEKKAVDAIDGFRSVNGIVNDSLNASDIDATPKPGSTAAKQYAEFRRQIDEKIINYREQNQGKKPDDKQVQEWVDLMLIKGKIPGSTFTWWGTEKRAFELKPGDKPTYKIADVPLSERRQIEAALIRKGKKATDDEIVKAFNNYMFIEANRPK